MRNYVTEGKLRLSLRDAVVLTLENNSEVRVRETQVETSKFSLLGAHGPFDPVLSSVDNINSTTSPPYTFLQGTGSSNVNFKSTTKSIQFNYSQMFESGTTFLGGFNTFINSSNSSFFLFNPYTASTLNFQLTQPLLREWMVGGESRAPRHRAPESAAIACGLCGRSQQQHLAGGEINTGRWCRPEAIWK